MKLLSVVQGTPEWLAARAKYHTASEAPAMMGASKHTTRSELLRMKATGDERAYSDWMQTNLLDKGHEAEAAARVMAEELYGEEFYPATGVDDSGYLLASFDGITMDGDVGFEHKLWNNDLAARVSANDLPPMYYWQLEHQALVGNLKSIFFVCSDGTEEKFAVMQYVPAPGRAEQLMAGWKQFDEDLANFKLVEVLPASVAKPIENLPALIVELAGQVTSSNLPAFKEIVVARIQAINTDLKTDQDFADADAMVKFLDTGEKKLEMVKAQALSQTASIDELFRTLDALKEEMRTKRLELNKLVEARKVQVRNEILEGGRDAFGDHFSALNKRLGKPYMPKIDTDFGGAMKGKRTIASLRDAVDTELARAKIEANAVADRIQINLAALTEADDSGFAILFPDAPQICLKANDDFALLVKSRIDAHKAAEAKREEEQREKIRQEEAAKLVAEQAAKTAAQESSAAQAPQAVRPGADEQAPATTPAAAAGPAAVSTLQRLRELITSELPGMTEPELRAVLNTVSQIKSKRQAMQAA